MESKYMKSISVTIEGQGPPSVMKISEVHIGTPKEGEVLIRHSVIGVNYIDVYQQNVDLQFRYRSWLK